MSFIHSTCLKLGIGKAVLACTVLACESGKVNGTKCCTQWNTIAVTSSIDSDSLSDCVRTSVADQDTELFGHAVTIDGKDRLSTNGNIVINRRLLPAVTTSLTPVGLGSQSAHRSTMINESYFSGTTLMVQLILSGKGVWKLLRTVNGSPGITTSGSTDNTFTPVKLVHRRLTGPSSRRHRSRHWKKSYCWFQLISQSQSG